MPQDQQEEIFHFIITLVAVKMKVKFPCKMTIEQAGHPLTSQASPSPEGKFIFNQEIRLRQESEKMFAELNICLITQKGARYISGIAKLYHNELVRSEGDRLVITLSKCLDTEAFCELRVDKVIKQGGGRKRTLTAAPQRPQKLSNPRLNEDVNNGGNDYKSPKRYQPPAFTIETKSEAHFPVTNNIRMKREESDIRAKDYIGQINPSTSMKRGVNLSPKTRSRPINSKSKYQPMQFNNNDYERDKVLEAQVYKDNYQKLKQKYLKEAQNSKNQLSKRILLQNNQNNYKLQIVRLKIRNQELQKNINQKNMRLKDLFNNLSSIQGRQGEFNMLRQDLMNKEHAIHIMQDTIITLSKQNDQLRAVNKQMGYKVDERICQLQNEIELISTRSANKQQQMERDIKSQLEAIQHKDNQIVRKNEMLEKEKRNVYELERSLQNKLFQYDALLQNEKGNCKQKIEESKSRVDEVNNLITKISNQKNQIIAELDKMKGVVLKNQYEFKLYQQEITTVKTELQDLRPIRDKYNQLLKDLRVVSEQKVILQKNHQKIVMYKENSIEELSNQYKKEMQFQKRSNKDLEERNKSISTKLIEAEGQLEITKSSFDKMKKSQQNLTKQYAELKEKEKILKKNFKIKEEECEDGKKQLSRLKQKSQNVLQSMKQELTKVREQLGKTKIELQSQIVKNQQLVETNSQLSMQLARLKMSLQFGEQKYQKILQSAQQKYTQFQKIIKQHQNVIELLEEKIRTQKSNEKDYMTKLQKCDYQISIVVQKNDKIIKDIKALQERNRQLQSGLKSKHSQLGQAIKKMSETQGKVVLTEECASQLRDQLQQTKNQLQKSKKIIQIIQKDYEKSKSDNSTYMQKLNDREKQIDQKNQQSRRDKQNISSLESKYATLKKQSDKFKDSVSDAINNSFIQLIQTFSMQKQESKQSPYSAMEYSVVNSAKPRGIIDMSNDLVSAINMAGKQNKTQLVKLTDRTKTLERDIDLLKGQLQRSQQNYKRQINQKANYIEQLEEEIRSTRNQKGQFQISAHDNISELEDQLKHFQNELQNLLSNKNQMQFTVSSLKNQIDRITEQSDRKSSAFKKQKFEYEEKIQYSHHSIQILEKKNHQLEVQIMNINSVLMLEKEQSYKKDLKLTEREEEKDKLNKDLQTIKKQFKLNQEKYSQLDIQYITIKEMKEKYQSMLSEEESKLKEIRVFNNSILKEKQEIIKKQLDKNLEITNLENSINELTHSLKQEEDSKNKFKAELQESKEIVKRYNLQIKDLQTVISQERAKYNEIRDKLRDKEQQLVDLRQENTSSKKKIEEAVTKNKNISQQLNQQIDMLTHQLETITSQSNQSIRSLESQLVKLNIQLQSSKDQLGQLQEAIFVQRENNHSMEQSINKLRVEVDQYKKKAEEMERVYEELAQENKEKDQHMFEMGGKIYQYQNRMREMEEEKQREIEELNNNLNVKYDEDYQEIYQKIQFIQKQKDYFKEKYNEKEEEIGKKNQELKHKEIQQLEMKKMFEEKIKKIEEEKLQIFTDKNKEIAKVLEDNKSQFENIRGKQSQNRKIVHELEISRNTIQKLQSKVKQTQNERNTQLKAYQTEIQNLRKKELIYKSYKDQVRSNQWNSEREVRKQIQNFIKKILQLGEKQVRNQNVIGLIKNLQQGLLNAISSVSKQ